MQTAPVFAYFCRPLKANKQWLEARRKEDSEPGIQGGHVLLGMCIALLPSGDKTLAPHQKLLSSCPTLETKVQ